MSKNINVSSSHEKLVFNTFENVKFHTFAILELKSKFL